METLGPLAAVAGVLALLGGTLWLLRRRGMVAGFRNKTAGRRLECVERLALGPQHILHLVRVGGQPMIVATFPGGCARLAAAPGLDEPAVGTGGRQPFGADGETTR